MWYLIVSIPDLCTITYFQDCLLLNAGQNAFQNAPRGAFCNTLPSFSYDLALRSLFCLFLSGRLRQALLYVYIAGVINRGHFQDKNYWQDNGWYKKNFLFYL